MADWDDEDFEPQGFDDKNATDKWLGEDEDDKDLKENWDDDESEKRKENSEENETTNALPAKKKKRPLKEILKEKEEKKMEEAKLKKEVEEVEPMTAEEALEEKLLQQKLQEDSDLLLAMETFGTSEKEPVETNNLESMNPNTLEEFTEYSKMLVEKLSKLESSALYVPFLDDTFRDLCASLEADDIKRLSSTLNLLHSEKVKAQKAKTKGKGKTKKITLAGSSKGGKKDDMDYSLGNEFDDFM